MRLTKYNNQPVKQDGHRFASKAEARRYGELRLLQEAGEIWGLKVHPRFTLQEPFLDNRGAHVRAITYEADFSYYERGFEDRYVVEDVKGKATAVFKIKEKLFRMRYPLIDLRIVPA